MIHDCQFWRECPEHCQGDCPGILICRGGNMKKVAAVLIEVPDGRFSEEFVALAEKLRKQFPLEKGVRVTTILEDVVIKTIDLDEMYAEYEKRDREMVLFDKKVA